MRKPLLLGSSVLVSFVFAAPAYGADWYVSPTGTATTPGCCSTRETPCSLASAAAAATAGDNVILMDGVYKEMLYIAGTGSADAWLTFKADDCATPIIEGPGVAPDADNQDNGVHSETGTYLRFIGIVSRGWNIGFGNKWTGSDNADSNGHWDYQYVLSYSNGRNGISFFSAEGIQIRNSITAHNGTSTAHSWSSGITLLQAKGSSNLVDGNLSFENTDAQNSSDGSGFIVDEYSDGVTFTNNIAFGNGGSCLRMTRSQQTKFINNTCYKNARMANPMGPTNPSEIYFTNGSETTMGISFWNNVLIATGTGGGEFTVVNRPSSGLMNNVEAMGAQTFLTAPEADNPDFTIAAGATSLIGKGMTGAGVPTTDLGWDPKCIVKRNPVMVGEVAKASWWSYDIDIDYIKSIGGVKGCFNPAARGTPPDIGAYKNGPVSTTTPGQCVPTPVTPPVGVECNMGGAGGMGGSGGDASSGASGSTGIAGTNPGGAPGAGGSIANAGSVATAGTVSAGGTVSSAGSASTSGGAATTAGSTSVAGSGTTAGTSSAAAGTSNVAPGASDAGAEDAGGCGCRLASEPSDLKSFAALGLFGFGLFAFQRRRRSR